MELIYTDPIGKELGYILNANVDMEIGEDEKSSINDFEIEFKRSGWNGTVEFGSQVYVPDTEYGGIVREVTTSTKANSITVKGYTWRGMMTKKIIKPKEGQDYAIASGEINEIILQLHIKLRPAHHTFQMGINSGNRRTFLRGGRFCKGRIVRQ